MVVKTRTRTNERVPSHASRSGAAAGSPRRRVFIALGAILLSSGLVSLTAALMSGGADREPSPRVTEPTPQARHAPVTKSGRPYRAFAARSWWDTPIPRKAPRHPAQNAILNYMSTAPDSGGGCLSLAGAGQSHWGQPMYWARPSDPSYDVVGILGGGPPELNDVRIPVGARPARNSDGSMSIFDLRQGYVTLLTDAVYDVADNQWSASGATVTYLHSNGLHVLTGQSDQRGNTGIHRGNNGATAGVRWDMVQAGAINHVLKVSSGPELANRWVFPMVGSDGDYAGSDPAVPPQGLRLRIKPSVDLGSLSLHPQALVIARSDVPSGFRASSPFGRT